MVLINGCKYCKYCFEMMPSDAVCGHGCTDADNSERFPEALEEGTVLSGKYVVGKVLGKGGFGITYLCFDIVHNCKVAIKEYFPCSMSHRSRGERTVMIVKDQEAYLNGADKFYSEAKLLSNLNHIDGIVKVLKLFKENNTVYIVMECLEGSDLKNHLTFNPDFDENYVVYLVLQTLKILDSIHKEGVLHRDISPDNIYICNDGRIKLIDFGAARIAVRNASKHYSIILKPGFAPVEQYQKDGNQGPWTDIYALGATMYYLLKRKPLLDAVSRLDDKTVDMTGISPEMAAILLKMIEPTIERRYANAKEVIYALEATQRSGTDAVDGVHSVPEVIDVICESHAHPRKNVVTEKKTKTYSSIAETGKNVVTTFENGLSEVDRLVSKFCRNPIAKWLFYAGCVCVFVLVCLLMLVAVGL